MERYRNMCQRILLNAQKRHDGKIRIMKLNTNKFFMILFYLFSILHYLPGATVWLFTKLWKLIKRDNSFLEPPRWWYGSYYCVLGRRIFEPEHFDIMNNPGTLAHEISHMDYQFFDDGELAGKPYIPSEVSLWKKLSYVFKYVFLKSFRWNVERLGYTQNARFDTHNHKEESGRFYSWGEGPRDYYVKLVSGPAYLWMVSEDKAKEFCDELKTKLEKEFEENTLELHLMGSRMDE
jgi:hypothetical protein